MSDARGVAAEAAVALRRVPRAVWCVVALHAVVLGLYTVALPTFRAPDEASHFDVVRVMEHGVVYPAYDGRLIDTGLLGAVDHLHIDRRSAHLTVEEARPRGERGSVESLRRDRSTTYNQIPQHPPLYYTAVGWTLRTLDLLLPGDPFGSYDTELGAARVLSLLFVAPLPLFVWWTARRLRAGPRAALAASILPLAVPQLQQIGAAVNNDTLFIGISGLFVVAVARIATGDVRRRMLITAGVLCGLALFTKAFAFVYPPVLLAAAFVGRRRFEPRDAASTLVPAFLAGGWWWLANLVRFGELSPSVEFRKRLDRVPAGFHADYGYWLREAVRRIGLTFFGNFGWYETWIPVGVMQIGWVCLAVVCIAPFVPIRRGGPTVAQQLVVLAPLVLGAVFVYANAARLYGHSGQLVLTQGRYVFGGLVGVFALAGVLFQRVRLQVAPVVALLAAVCMQCFAARAILSYYWGPATASLGGQFRALLAWSPWPPMFVAGALAALVLAFVATCHALVGQR